MAEVTKRKAGRPPKILPDEETFSQIRELGALFCTIAEAGAVMGVNRDTLSDFLHRYEPAMEAWEQGKEIGKVELRRMQFEQAKTSPAMAIWLGKQYLGQKDHDKIEIGGIPEGIPVQLEHGMAEGLTALLHRARLEHAKNTKH